MKRTKVATETEEASDGRMDRIDLRLLRLLQGGRLTTADLAQRANVSAAACHRCTQRLLAEGFVRFVRALIEPQRVERSTLVLVGVVLETSTEESFAASRCKGPPGGGPSINWRGAA